MRNISMLLVFLTLVACQSTPPPAPGPFYGEAQIPFAKWKRTNECCTASGNAIAVASGGLHASQAALEIEKKGGNAIDAAVAVAFALSVERPFSCGIGGGGFMLVRPADGKPMFVDFRETAPHRATRDMYLDANGAVIPNKSLEGGMAVATPGFVPGLWQIHKKWGKLPWKDVLAPAIRLAEEGFAVAPTLAGKLTKSEPRIKSHPYLAKIFLHPDGTPLQEGEIFKQPDLAGTLRLVAKEGERPFTRGKIAKAIAATVKKDGGILDEKDLASYKVRFRPPIEGKWQGYQIWSAPPPSAGGVAMVQMLNVLSGYDLAAESKSPAGWAHLLSQVMKRAYADRSRYIGDSDFVKTNYPTLLKPDYADAVRKKISRTKDTPSKEINPGDADPTQHGTTHLSLIDSEGNAVAATITINNSWGALLPVPGTGILLNNEMDDFSLKPGEQNVYGLTGGDANAIAPGKRPVSSMTPTVVVKDGKPVLAVGGGGGSRIISSVFQVVLNDLVVFPGDVKKAVFAPRVHHQWLPDQLDLEEGYPEPVVKELNKLGHKTSDWAWKAEVHAVGRDTAGKLTAVFDPRQEGGVAAQ